MDNIAIIIYGVDDWKNNKNGVRSLVKDMDKLNKDPFNYSLITAVVSDRIPVEEMGIEIYHGNVVFRMGNRRTGYNSIEKNYDFGGVDAKSFQGIQDQKIA